jgi:hypothetical protein
MLIRLAEVLHPRLGDCLTEDKSPIGVKKSARIN